MKRGPAACLLAWLVVAATATAAPRLTVVPAFDAWREGDLVALRLSIENDGPAGLFGLSARSFDVEDRPTLLDSIELAARARKTHWLSYQPSSAEVEVALSRDGQVLDAHRVTLREQPWSLHLVACLGSPPAGLARQLEGARGRRARARLTETSADRLPDEALLWPSIDVLVWPAPLSHELTPRQASALLAWVSDGGRLIAGTHPEDPQALEALGLVPDAFERGGKTLGWGSVQLVDESLARADAATWLAWLRLREEHPSARTLGPSSLTRRAQAGVEGAIEPPMAAAGFLLGGTLLALIVAPWVRARRAARGEALGRPRWPVTLSVIALSIVLAFVLAHFGAGRGLVVDRLDIVDVDVSKHRVRAHSVIALRRARSGPLGLDTRDAGRLRVLDASSQRLSAGGGDGMRHRLSGDAAASTAEVHSWETIRLDARWRPESLALPDLTAAPELLHLALGAERAAVKRGSSLEWLADGAPAKSNDLANAARWFRNSRTGNWLAPPTDLKEFMEAAVLTLDAGQQWRWPGNERWPSSPGQDVLVALAPGRSAPPLFVDGRDVSGKSWTLWRVRLAGRDEGRP